MRVDLKSLREGDSVKEIYLCKQRSDQEGKTGKKYISLVLQDKSGSLDGKVWNLSSGIDNFEALDFIHIEGQVTSYQGQLQLNIVRIRKALDGEYSTVDFSPSSSKDIAVMFKEVQSYVDGIRQPQLKKLLESFFVTNESFKKSFCRHSAAKTLHHAFVGGLLEHTLAVANLCDYLAGAYPFLNRDLLIASALFHDIGKTKELTDFPSNEYSDGGNLLGHIYIGTEMVAAGISHIPDFPLKLALELKHCILAHHGSLEFGSPKLPALAEAIAISMSDNLDAKLQAVKEIMENADDRSEWVGWQKVFETNMRRTGTFIS